jgi:hypothetical protein
LSSLSLPLSLSLSFLWNSSHSARKATAEAGQLTAKLAAADSTVATLKTESESLKKGLHGDEAVLRSENTTLKADLAAALVTAKQVPTKI